MWIVTMPTLLRTVAILVLALPAACNASPPRPPRVAEGDGVVITTAEMQARIDALTPADRARVGSPEARRALLDSWILFDLMAREAERAGMRADGDSGEAGKKRMVQKFVVSRFHDPEGPRTIPDADARAYYEEHRDTYFQPVKTRLAHIVLECPEGSPRRPARATEAARLRERIVRDRASDPDPFRSAMEDITRARDPETQAIFLGLVSQDHLGDFLPPTVAQAAWDLGPEAPSPVLSSPRGFHLLQNYGGQPALHRTLEQARGEIQTILYQARMAEAYRQWTAQLREKAHVRIDEAALARVRVDPGSPPTLTPVGPAGR